MVYMKKSISKSKSSNYNLNALPLFYTDCCFPLRIVVHKNVPEGTSQRVDFPWETKLTCGSL